MMTTRTCLHFFKFAGLLLVTLLLFGACKSKKERKRPVRVSPIYSRGPIPTISVAHADRSCEKDGDCVRISKKCACDCGIAVHRKKADLYRKALGKKCANYRTDRQCNMRCFRKIRCLNKVCSLTR